MSKKTPTEYRRHHYVPQWYQKRFLEPVTQQKELHQLALEPRFVTDANGVRRSVPQQRRRPIGKVFAEDDLYTLRFGEGASSEIERAFFGEIDDRGAHAVAWWSNFAHPALDHSALHGLIAFMSSQKLRTPKGLDWLARQVSSTDPNVVLSAMVFFRSLFSAIWTEAVWQLADAKTSETKFIITDHPVSVYHRECGPRHEWCRGANDPDIRLHGSHTIFPINLDRLLIFTNRSWVLDPYQSARQMRPNPDFYRDSLFNVFEVQTHRELAEDEVRQINFILKNRAYRYIAAAREEWLYPEEFVSKSDWANFGDGYLFMPDPRGLHDGGEIFLGYEDGSSEAFDVFGRRPWQHDYADYEHPSSGRRSPLDRLKGEFARRLGPRRRGRAFHLGRLDVEEDDERMHEYYLSLNQRGRR